MRPLLQEPGDGRRYGPGQAAHASAGYQGELEERKAKFRNRATAAWVDGILPGLPLDQTGKNYMQVALEVADQGGDIGGYLDGVVPDDYRKQVSAGLVGYTEWMEGKEANPLALTTRSRKDLTAVKNIIEQPGGRDTLRAMADLTGDQTILDTVNAIELSVAQAQAARVLGAGPAAPVEYDYKVSSPDLGVALGIQQGLEQASRGVETVKWGGRDPGSYTREFEQDVNPQMLDFYMERVGQFQEIALNVASKRDISVGDLGRELVTAADGRAVIGEVVRVLEEAKPEALMEEGIALEIASQAQVAKASAAFLKAVDAYAKANPEEEVRVAEAMQTVVSFMEGEVREDEALGVPSLLSKALHVIAAPDMAAASLTTAAQPKIRPVALVFEDGFVAYDTIAAAQHSLEMQAKGGVQGQSPEAYAVSEAGRAEALLGSAGEAVKKMGEERSLLPFVHVANAVDVATRAAQAGAYGIGANYDLVFGELGRKDEAGVLYAYPTPVFETVTEAVPWGERWGDAIQAVVDGDGEFIVDGIYDQANSGITGSPWERRWASWIMAAGVEFAVSPWNAAGTGKVSAEAADAARRGIGGEAAKTSAAVKEMLQSETKKKSAVRKPKREVKFDDGREMNATWVGAHDLLARRFGRGKGPDMGASDDLASMVLTAVRDNPTKTTREVLDTLKADPGYNRRLASYVPDLAMPGVYKGAFGSEEMARQVQRTWEAVEGDVQSILDATVTRMGPKWDDAASRAAMMEQARGLFIGGLEVLPTTRARRVLDKADEAIRETAKADVPKNAFGMDSARAAMNKRLAGWYSQFSDALNNGAYRLKSGFSADAYATGLPAHGGRNILPEVKPVPFRMKKMFQEQYRRRVAAGEQQAQSLISDTFVHFKSTGKGKKVGARELPAQDRRIVTLLTEEGDDINAAARALFADRDFYAMHGVNLPDTAEGMAALTRRLEPFVTKYREVYGAIEEGIVQRGLVRPDQVVDTYSPRIYKGITQDKLQNYLDSRLLDEGAERAAKKVVQGKGTHARQRHGPVTMREAMEQGFDPELDAAALLYARAIQYAEYEAKSIFAERIAMEFGQPVIGRRETLGKMLQDSNTSAWEANKAVWDNAEHAKRYNKSLGKVAKAITQSDYQGMRSRQFSLAKKLGVGMSDLRDPAVLTKAMVESEDFWKMAGSKGKNMLDKILPASVREGLRKQAREIRAAKARVDKLRPKGPTEALVTARLNLAKLEAKAVNTMADNAWGAAAEAIRDETSNLLAANRLVEDRIAAHASRYDMASWLVRHRALGPRTVKALDNQVSGRSTAKYANIQGFKPSDIRTYIEAEEAFEALGWSKRDQSALLWKTFGAHHLTEIPPDELKALVSVNGGMMAKVGRFMFDKTDDAGRRVYNKLVDQDAGREIAEKLNVQYGVPHWEDDLFDRLSDLWDGVEAGDPKAIKLAESINPGKLSRVFVPQDIGEVASAIAKQEVAQSSAETAARMVSQADSPLSRKLGNTYIPLEIGLMHKQMVKEGLTAGQDLIGYAMTTKMLRGLADKISVLDGFNLAFKAGATIGRGSFAFGRRNAWFDGAKNLLHLGLYGSMNPKVRREFVKDMTSRTGFIDTPNGPVSRKVFHQYLDQQGYSMFSQRLDQAAALDTSAAQSVKGKRPPGARRRDRFEKEIAKGIRLRNPGKGLDLEKEQIYGIGVGGSAGILAGDPLLGAAIGYTGGTLTHSFRDVVSHTGGSLARKTDFMLPLGAAANERMENWYRSFAYWSYTKSGMGPQEAMNRMLGSMRDYSNMTPLGQDILRRVPVLFYNFTHQNVIAMGQRMALSPARTTFFPRLIMALTGKDEGSEDFQTVANALKVDGIAYYMSDELEAAIAIFEPLWQLSNGQVGKALEAAGENVSPVVSSLAQFFADGDGKWKPMPQAIARNLYDQLGEVDIAGFQVGVNESGAIYGRMNSWANFLLSMSAMEITANDVGKAHNWVDRGEVSRAVLEYFFGVKSYDLDSFFEGRRELLDTQMQKVFDGLDGLQWDEKARNLIFSDPNLYSAEHQVIMRQFAEFANGKHLLQGLKDMDRELRAFRGESKKLVPTQPMGDTPLEIPR